MIEFLFGKHWRITEATWTAGHLGMTLWIIASVGQTWIGLISAAVCIGSLGFVTYTAGRRHQQENDHKLVAETVQLSSQVRDLLKECYFFETWYFDMRPDETKEGRLVIHSRVCPN